VPERSKVKVLVNEALIFVTLSCWIVHINSNRVRREHARKIPIRESETGSTESERAIA